MTSSGSIVPVAIIVATRLPRVGWSVRKSGSLALSLYQSQLARTPAANPAAAKEKRTRLRKIRTARVMQKRSGQGTNWCGKQVGIRHTEDYWQDAIWWDNSMVRQPVRGSKKGQFWLALWFITASRPHQHRGLTQGCHLDRIKRQER